jgi:hypothetical protein
MSRTALLAVGGAALAAGLVVFLTVFASAPPTGPVEPVWDRTSCAWCRMHVGEPAFAAQLHTSDGDVLFFDDPGCLFELEAEQRPAVHARFFRHMRADRWLSGEEAAFVAVEQSPMGYGLGAVDGPAAGVGALDLAGARAKVLARSQAGSDQSPAEGR